MRSPSLFIIVGASGSGKGLLLRSVRDMGEKHIVVIPKATTRAKKTTDGDEFLFFPHWTDFPAKFDVVYGNYKASYGIPTSDIWEVLRCGKHALLICSNFASLDEGGKPLRGHKAAIPHLCSVFGPLAKLVYLHSHVTQEEAEDHQRVIGAENAAEIETRKSKISTVRKYYVENIALFDHVLLNVGDPEDLSDQMFRLIRWYSGRL